MVNELKAQKRDANSYVPSSYSFSTKLYTTPTRTTPLSPKP